MDQTRATRERMSAAASPASQSAASWSMALMTSAIGPSSLEHTIGY